MRSSAFLQEYASWVQARFAAFLKYIEIWSDLIAGLYGQILVIVIYIYTYISICV